MSAGSARATRTSRRRTRSPRADAFIGRHATTRTLPFATYDAWLRARPGSQRPRRRRLQGGRPHAQNPAVAYARRCAAGVVDDLSSTWFFVVRPCTGGYRLAWKAAASTRFCRATQAKSGAVFASSPADCGATRLARLRLRSRHPMVPAMTKPEDLVASQQATSGDEFSEGCAWVAGRYLAIDQAGMPLTDARHPNPQVAWFSTGLTGLVFDRHWHGLIFRRLKPSDFDRPTRKGSGPERPPAV